MQKRQNYARGMRNVIRSEAFENRDSGWSFSKMPKKRLANKKTPL
jgi:hypothetical protein